MNKPRNNRRAPPPDPELIAEIETRARALMKRYSIDESKFNDVCAAVVVKMEQELYERMKADAEAMLGIKIR
jgi:hypothetical protein